MLGLLKKPWDDSGDLESSLRAVERVAEAHGFRGPRRPTFTRERLDAAAARLGFALPGDLAAFMAWYDAGLWTRFVNPEELRISDMPCRVMQLDGTITEAGSDSDEVDDELRIFDPEDWEVVIPSDSTGGLHGLYLADIAEGEFLPRSWGNARFIMFGSSRNLDTLYFSPDIAPNGRGAIVVKVTDNPGLLIVGTSLAHWLSRLAAMDGSESYLYPGSLDEIPGAHRRALLREFKAQNPKSSWLKP